MKIFTISSKSPVMFGSGAALRVADKLKEKNCKKVFLLTDETVRKLGLCDGVIKSLEDAGIEYIIFDEVHPDPTDKLVHRASELYKKAGCDGIVAVGGGAVLDTGKGVKALSTNPPPINQYWGRKPMKPGDPLVLVTTTIGTGSEVSIAAVISDTTTGLKPAILNTAIQAELSVVDSQLTKGLPKFVTACSIADIFQHALETMTSTYRNLNSTIMAKVAL